MFLIVTGGFRSRWYGGGGGGNVGLLYKAPTAPIMSIAVVTHKNFDVTIINGFE